MILDFTANDRIDLSALEFTGLGNGHDHTLRVEVDAAGARTYLKSYDADESGSRFQVSFEGDVSQYLKGDGIVFAPNAFNAFNAATAPSDQTTLPAPELADNAMTFQLLGMAEQTHSGIG